MSQQITKQEQEKLAVITDCLSGKLTKAQASRMLGISPRQIKRLKSKLREEGPLAIVHGLKGKQSNHHITEAIKQTALTLIEEKYPDFKPSFATEKLAEHHAIHISPETTRLWMMKKGLWKPQRQKQTAYRSWRPRKDYFGELEQFDGSYHYWFEKRYCDDNGNPLEVCLLAAIDDATGQITKAMFAPHEGVIPVFAFWKEYTEEIGKPVSIYLDSFSTYKINHRNAVDNKELMTQFQRAMRELGIQLITAHSPEAKGRVERLFGTLQDRLVKEMRLADISTPEEGNRFLQEVFLKAFNERFSVIPAKEGDVHRPLLREEKEHLHHVFSLHDTRRINLDFTIQFQNTWYQLTEIQPTTVRPLMRVTMEIWLDQTIHIVLNHHELTFALLPEKPKRKRIKQPIILTTHTLNYKPPLNHPWRRYPNKT